MPTFESLQGEYRRLWHSMIVPKAREATIASSARRVMKNKPRYVAVEQQVGVPWFLIAILHNRESGMDFRTHLHNGDPLTARTRQVPAGRPKTGKPPFTWEESATDALMMAPHALHQVQEWSIERICYEAEKYNGWGYRNHATPSAYLWSYSTNYHGGKYVADGVWSASAVDKQLGCMPLLRFMMDLDPAISETLDIPQPKPKPEAPKPPAPTPPVPKPIPPPDVPPVEPKPPKPASQSKTIWAAIATFLTSLLGALSDWRMLAVLVVGALIAFIVWERLKRPDILGLFR